MNVVKFIDIYHKFTVFVVFRLITLILIVNGENIKRPPGIENNNVFVTERLVDYKTVKLETMKHYAIYSKSLTYSIF